VIVSDSVQCDAEEPSLLGLPPSFHDQRQRMLWSSGSHASVLERGLAILEANKRTDVQVSNVFGTVWQLP